MHLFSKCERELYGRGFGWWRVTALRGETEAQIAGCLHEGAASLACIYPPPKSFVSPSLPKAAVGLSQKSSASLPSLEIWRNHAA